MFPTTKTSSNILLLQLLFILFYQELLTYLAMFVKTHPVLFDGMLQVRIGLIMEVMAAEYARTTGLTGKKDAFFSTTFTFLCNSCIFTQA